MQELERDELTREWIKAIYSLKKSLDNWTYINLQDLWDGEFQPSFMQFLINIDPLGSTNNELAKKSGISKQAMSKIVSKMAVLELIVLTSSQKDKRSQVITLTEKGRYIVSESIKRLTDLISNYVVESIDADTKAAVRTLKVINQFIAQFNLDN
jgi:DNA-binding MarR family transcriptional regulator